MKFGNQNRNNLQGMSWREAGFRKSEIKPESRTFLILCLVVSCFIHYGDAHGRLIEPPSRASAWRYGFQTPPDYNDHELYCGGFTRQWKHNGGKCGECGDAWDLPEPRPHEHGGQWGQGVVVRSYLPSSEIIIRVELTASHMGYFEFRLCPKPSAKQSCLDQNVLHIISGSPSQRSPADLDSRFYPRNGSRIYEIKAQLPDLLCNQCVLQWRYIAGNNWGLCDDGNGAVGCGPQEEFRSCSDIALTKDARLPNRPVRPIHRITTPATIPNNDQVEVNNKQFTSLIFLIGFILLLLISGLVISSVYIFLKPAKLIEWRDLFLKKFCQKQKKAPLVNLSQSKPVMSLGTIEKCEDNSNTSQLPSLLNTAPIPPPRTKRDMRIKEISIIS